MLKLLALDEESKKTSLEYFTWADSEFTELEKEAKKAAKVVRKEAEKELKSLKSEAKKIISRFEDEIKNLKKK